MLTRPDFTLLSPVKINLFLHITGRREDDYHLLQTLFQFLEYGDQIGFSVNLEGRLERIDNHSFTLPQDDLCLQAARLLRDASGNKSLGASITLEKKIPPGSGLGAGSSNAATTLLALNKLWETDFSKQQLFELGAQLGADVPIFLHGESAWAEGIGDTFRAYYPEIRWFCVIIPGVQVATKEIFADPGLDRNHAPITFQNFIDGETTNVLEPIAVARYPVIGEALGYLSDFGVARMSGTGSAVFVAVQTHELADELLQRIPQTFTGFTARSVNHNPVIEQLKRL
jgi:4-diphosphocytidyl-2-C-methyl-D-erythritol kinase